MKKLLFSAILLATNFAFGQITLEHSFDVTENVTAYSKRNETFYVSYTNDNKLKIYNADYSLKKTINIPLPTNYDMYLVNGIDYAVSQHIFNTDDKYEFLVLAYSTFPLYKLLLINEDGELIKDFHPNPEVKGSYYGTASFEIFHDNIVNRNKIKILNYLYDNGTQIGEQYDIYSLPTSELGSKEIQSKGKLSAFPVPANKILNIINPNNGANVVEIYDASGKLIINKSFSKTENRISVEVENLPKGFYTYKIGNQNGKFIKN